MDGKGMQSARHFDSVVSILPAVCEALAFAISWS